MNKKKIFALALLAAAVALPASAKDGEDNSGRGSRDDNKIKLMAEIKSELKSMQRPELVGKITAINGTTLTVTGKSFGTAGASTTFTVNASSATVIKGNATTTVSTLAVGDVVLVRGTLSGSTITAKLIHSGVRGDDRKDDDKDKNKSGILNNGQPVIVGKVIAVSGTMLTVQGSASTTYSVNAASSTVKSKGNATTTLSSITVGDNVIVQGAVNGSSVTATTIVEQNGDNNGKGKGFFARIGSFFKSFFKF
jgi:hypothetical protein